jgi:hypothetical protein
MSDAFSKSWQGDYGKGLRDAVEQELRQIGIDGERLVSKAIELKGAVDQGDLKGSVVHEYEEVGGRQIVRFGPDAKHAVFVLEGTRPHWAPIEPLKEWARRKLGDADIGYAVQHKIARQGTDARDFLSGPFRKLRQETPERLEGAITDELND